MSAKTPMKLSSNTTNILKNFSQINQSILIKQGNKLKTISVMKNILAEAEIEEEFEKDFAIYDLNQFLSGLSLYDSPDLDFGESYLTIRDGRRRAKYFFADPDVIVSPPEKEISLPTRDVCFTVATQQLDKLLKAAAIYQVPDLSASVAMVRLNLLSVIRRMTLLTNSVKRLVKLRMSSISISRLRTSRSFLVLMTL
jgi:hypothetical protein